MLIYNIVLKKSFKKQTKNIPDKYFRKIIKSINDLKYNPFPPGHKKLSSTIEDIYRIRVGDYRIIYEINYNQIEIVIIKIGHRRDVYD